MRTRTITRVVDAMASQSRMVYWLDCRHTFSLTRIDLEALPSAPLPKVGDRAPCVHCPDPTPEEVRRDKSAAQLWREAGEP